MTNEELQEAITMANAMVKAASQDAPRYPMLLEHLQTLLREQQRRASAAPTPFMAPHGPVIVQPVVVQPTWVPSPSWEPPYRVTC